MNILFIGGVFAADNEREIIDNSRGYAEFSANIFQRKLINGFLSNGESLDVLSAPLIGAYPFRYKKIRFGGFQIKQHDYHYVNFCNIWGIRNMSRANALKRKIRILCKRQSYDLIIVYSAHEPFLNAAVYAKSLCGNAKICYVVPDLPEYMNLNEDRSFIYDFFKKIDIWKMNRLSENVDSFVILTEPMKDKLHIGGRPYLVVEGLVDESEMSTEVKTESDGLRRVVYTGKMNFRFGIKELVDAFMEIKDADCRLILCGDGDARDYIIAQSKADDRIEFMGQVTPAEAKAWMLKADVLVNPRPNNEDYTKYSFPSKNIEYLMTGKPVVAYMLDGMNAQYKEFLFIEDRLSSSIVNALICGINKHYNDFLHYAEEHLDSRSTAKKIVELGEQ